MVWSAASGRRGLRTVGVLAVAAGLAALAAGCSAAADLAIPNPSQVRSLEVQDLAAPGGVPVHPVTDAGQIAAFLRVLRSLNDHMYVPADTYPSPTYTVAVNDASGTGLVVFVGGNWVGGRNNTGGSRDTVLRTVSPEQRRQLLQTVGLAGD